MNTKLINGILLIILLFGSVFIIQSTALALDQEDESDDDEEIDEEDKKAAFERDVEVYADNRSLEIESALEYNNTEEAFYVYFNNYEGDDPGMSLEYSTENSTTESELSYTVNFVEIIEFDESGDTSGYDQNDTVLSVYDLSEVAWNNLDYNTYDINGTTIHKAVATTADGVFSLIMYVSGSFANINGSQVTPNAVKIDVEIHNYDYNGTNSHLAVQTDVSTESEFEIDNDTYEEQNGFANNESQLSINSTSAAGFFSWVETATADGSTVNVLNSGLLSADLENDEETNDLEPGETEGIMYFTFDVQNATDIIWDPKVGVVSEGAESNLKNLTSDTSTDTATDSQTDSTTNTGTTDESSIGSETDDNNTESTSLSLWLASLGLLGLAPIVLLRRRNL